MPKFSLFSIAFFSLFLFFVESITLLKKLVCISINANYISFGFLRPFSFPKNQDARIQTITFTQKNKSVDLTVHYRCISTLYFTKPLTNGNSFNRNMIFSSFQALRSETRGNKIALFSTKKELHVKKASEGGKLKKEGKSVDLGQRKGKEFAVKGKVEESGQSAVRNFKAQNEDRSAPSTLKQKPAGGRIAGNMPNSAKATEDKKKANDGSVDSAKKRKTKFVMKNRRKKMELEQKEKENLARATSAEKDQSSSAKEKFIKMKLAEKKKEADNDSSVYLKFADKIKKEDLKGFDLPYGLVSEPEWELFKLYGRIADPEWPYNSYYISSRFFRDRLFGKHKSITENEFNMRIENKFNFLAPSCGKEFLRIREICWFTWMLVRDAKDIPSFDLSIGKRVIPNSSNELPIDFVRRRVNKEINQQGVHPAALRALWKFFNPSNKNEISESECLERLNTLMTTENVRHEWMGWRREKKVDADEEEEELLRPRVIPQTIINTFYREIESEMKSFDFEEYMKYEAEVLLQKAAVEELIQKNSEWRRQRKTAAVQSKEMFEKYMQTNDPRIKHPYNNTKKKNI